MHASLLRLSQATTTRIRLVALNDVYELKNLPKLQTFLSEMETPPHAVILPGNFLKSSPLSALDQGRAVCRAMVASGITHLCWGHAEGGVDLSILRDRLVELSSKITLINTNLRSLDLKQENEYSRIHTLRQHWDQILDLTPAYATIHASSDDNNNNVNVNVALMGLLSDERTMFRDNLFRGVVPIENCLDAFTRNYKELLQPQQEQPKPKPENADSHALLQKILQQKRKELGLLEGESTATTPKPVATKDPQNINFILPVTHQSTQRDRELARHMLRTDSHGIYEEGGIIIGGHYRDDNHATLVEEVCDEDHPNRTIQIIKTGRQAKQAAWIDLEFDEDQKLKRATTQIIELESAFADSFVIKSILDKQWQVVQNLENEVIVDCSHHQDEHQQQQLLLSSKSSNREQTTVGTLVCNAIKEELQAHAAILHAGALHGDTTYPDNTMTYAQLKQELVSDDASAAPSSMVMVVVVPMTRLQLYSAITYARMNASKEPNGFLQTDSDLSSLVYPSAQQDEIIQVAMPRNLLVAEEEEEEAEGSNGKVLPLLQLGKALEDKNGLPARQDGTPLMDLVIRNSCKNRWVDLFQNTPQITFEGIDLNSDGVLDKEEITLLLTKVLRYKPQDYVIDDMIQSIDQDGNGVIDKDEFNFLLARLERHKNQRQT